MATVVARRLFVEVLLSNVDVDEIGFRRPPRVFVVPWREREKKIMWILDNKENQLQIHSKLMRAYLNLSSTLMKTILGYEDFDVSLLL